MLEEIPVKVLVGVAAGAVALLVMLTRRKKARCTSTADLTGKTVIVTGANTGIGYWTARDLAARNARVILACRSRQRGEAAKKDIVVATGNENVAVLLLDLANFDSVRKFAQQIMEEEDRLDILINNAGVFGVPQPPDLELEITMATNHFGHFLLTLLLLDMLKKSVTSRIINVSSGAQAVDKAVGIDFNNLCCEKPQSSFKTYAASKLANVLFTQELSSRLAGTGVTAYCLHPGMVITEIARHLPRLVQAAVRILLHFFLLTAEEGAQTSIFLAVTDQASLQSGQYYIDCALAPDKLNPLAHNRQLAEKLWEVSAQVTGVSPLV